MNSVKANMSQNDVKTKLGDSSKKIVKAECMLTRLSNEHGANISKLELSRKKSFEEISDHVAEDKSFASDPDDDFQKEVKKLLGVFMAFVADKEYETEEKKEKREILQQLMDPSIAKIRKLQTGQEEEFLKAIKQYQDDCIHLYTNGTWKGLGSGRAESGCAIALPNCFKIICIRTESKTSLEAKVEGILRALDFLLAVPRQCEVSAVIYTDSLASLDSIVSKKAPKKGSLIGRLQATLVRASKQLKSLHLLWVPGHCEIYCNLQADKGAHYASTNKKQVEIIEF
jgi:ribonuclease HI